MYDSWKKWFVKWMAVVFTVVMGMGLCAGLPVGAAYENTHTNTGNQRADIVAIAQTQVGYREGSLDGTTSGSNNYTKYNVDLYKIDGSYCYAWCQSFIAWCAKQAGVSSSVIKRTAGTIDAMDFFKSQQVWQGNSYTPQSGDIIYFRSSSSNSGYHVGIVESVSGSTIHTIEGNYSNKVARHSVSVGASSIVGYGVPNYEGVTPPDPPTVSIISIDRNVYTIGENVIFHVRSDTASSYTIGIHKNGNPYDVIWNFTDNDYTYTLTEAGDYYAYVSSSNSAGYKDSDGIWFTVYDTKPSESVLSISKIKYSVGENVDFKFSSDTATSYTIGIHKEGNPYDIIYDINQKYYSYELTQPGNYYAYVCSSNSLGYLNSNGVWFTVYDTAPSKSDISIDKSNYTIGENIVFSVSSDTATAYSIGLYKDGERYTSFWDFREDYYNYTLVDAGKYSAYVTAYNSFGYKDSKCISFVVHELFPGDLNTDGTLTSSDTLLLQDYLLGRSVLTNDQKQQADLNQDGVIDGFDLAFLKHLLLASE